MALKCPVKSLKERPGGSAPAGQWLGSLAAPGKLPCSFWRGGSSGRTKCTGLSPSTCACSAPLTVLAVPEQPGPGPSLHRQLSFLPDCFQLPVRALFQPLKGPAHGWSVAGTEHQAAWRAWCSPFTLVPEGEGTGLAVPLKVFPSACEIARL